MSLVPSGATWSYNDTGTDLGTAWQAPAYADSNWASGKAQLGYGDGDEVTIISFGPDSNNKYRTTYFRHRFTVADPTIYSSLSLEVLRDDGCVVYLNGQEVARYGMPAGTITYSTYASSATEYSWDPPQAIANLLLPGDNVIAVEVHQGNATSSDLSLDLRLTGTSEIAVTLDSPAADAGGVAIPVVLTATASDPEDQPLTVDFYGRLTPPSVPDFTLVVLPDTQFYTDEINGGSKDIFISQTQWIVNNRAARNIVYVAHMGDVSNNGDKYPDEWQNAGSALYLLEDPLTTTLSDGIPYGAAVGNHDRIVPAGDSEPTTYWNDYLGVSHFGGRSYYGGHYGNNNNNSFQLFSASGLDFIVLYLEYDTSPDQAVLDWADARLKEYPNRRGIVVTHFFLNLDGTFGTQGAAIYNALKDNSNLFLMLCGHNHGEALRTDVYAGNTVHTLLADYQSYPNGGNGFLRIMEFSPDNNQIRVHTYSPWLDQDETDANSDFTLDYNMQAGPAFELVQRNSGVPSGAPTSAIWTGLEPGADYQWFVTATDGTEARASEIRRFTTSVNTPPSVAITSPLEGAVFPDAGDITITADAGDSDGQVVKVEFYAGLTKLGEAVTSPYELTSSLAEGSYSLTALAWDNGGAMTLSTAVQITVGGAPLAPTGLTATAQSSTEILLSWTDASANESGFKIHESTDGEVFFLIGQVGPDVATALVTGLDDSTTYHFIVSAYNGAGSSNSDVAICATPASPPVPDAPSDLIASPWSDSEVRLSWADNSSDETSFLIERSSDGEAWTESGTVSADTTSAFDSGLPSGTVYYYRVLACNAVGCGEPTEPAAAAAYVYSLATGETLVAGSQSGTYLDTHADDEDSEQLSEQQSGGKPSKRYSLLEHKWTFDVTPGSSVTFFVQAHQLSGGDDDTFALAYSSDDVTYHDMVMVTPATEPGECLTFDLPTGLQGNVFIRVRDTDQTAGHSALDTLVVDHLMIRTTVVAGTGSVVNPPDPPVLQEAVAGDAVVTLNWSASGGATSYTVWRKADGGSFSAIATGVPGTSYPDIEVVNGTTYDYQVTAVNADGESGPSNMLSVTPQAETTGTEPPTNLNAASAKKKINLSWLQSPTPGIVQNKVYRSTSEGGNYLLLNTISAGTTYSDAVSSGSTYYYRVTAVSTTGESAPSNTAVGTAK